MSTSFFLSFGLISILLIALFDSCLSTSRRINTLSDYQYDRYSPTINSDEQDIRFLLENDDSFTRNQRASSYYPRSNRNSWFRVSTYQRFKPSGSEETPSGDHLMRWGR